MARKPKRTRNRYEKPISEVRGFFIFIFNIGDNIDGFRWNIVGFLYRFLISVVLFHIGPLSPTTEHEISVSVGKPYQEKRDKIEITVFEAPFLYDTEI